MWLGETEMLTWFARSKTVIHPVLAAAAGNGTRDHQVASPTLYNLHSLGLYAAI